MILIPLQVATKRELLQDGIKLWEELDSVATPLNEWIERTEVDVKERKVFGDSLDEAKEFKKTISVITCMIHLLCYFPSPPSSSFSSSSSSSPLSPPSSPPFLVLQGVFT